MAHPNKSTLIHFVKWGQYLSDARVADATQLDGPLVWLESDTSALDALRTLVAKNISSAPVFNKAEKKIVGSICLLDVVILITGTAAGLGLVEHDADVSKVRVDELMNLSYRNPWRTVTDQAAIIVAMDVMGGQHVHRLAIKYSHPPAGEVNDPQSVIRGYLTQTSLTNWLIEKAREKLPNALMMIKVRDFLRSPIKKVTAVKESAQLREAFDMLWIEGRNAVAVVDENDVLTGTVSVSDLKYLTPENASLEPVRAMLHRSCADFMEQRNAAKRESALLIPDVAQQVCGLDDTLEQITDKVQEHHVHRLWVVDDGGRPIGVVSLGDIIHQLQHAIAVVEV